MPKNSFERNKKLSDQERTVGGCSTVGRAVASDTRGPLFESSHRQIYIFYMLSTAL